MNEYMVKAGPEGYLPPAASFRGVVLPEPGRALVEGIIVSEKEAMAFAVKKLLGAKNPAFFPGPQLLWDWKDGVSQKAKAVRDLAVLLGAQIIPMPDYRPKYPMINPQIEINPNHPNLTIWQNQIDVCVLVGVHCHYANVALKIIRGGTDCYTIALCEKEGHEDSMISLRDVNLEKLKKLYDLALESRKQVCLPCQPIKVNSVEGGIGQYGERD